LKRKDGGMDLKMPYGKYKGIEIYRMPSGYLRWISKYFNIEKYCKAADEEWQYREHFDCHFDEVLEKK
jgi:hypothetical protein